MGLMETFYISWFTLGFFGALFARWAWRLKFRKKLNLGGVLGFALGVVVGPVSVLGGVIWTAMWAFESPLELKYSAVAWPAWWINVQRITRKVWYFGNPPADDRRLPDPLPVHDLTIAPDGLTVACTCGCNWKAYVKEEVLDTDVHGLV